VRANTSACIAAVLARIPSAIETARTPLAGAFDALVHQPMGVTVPMLVAIVVRMLVAVVGVVFVRPCVRVDVA
jgi:hypothetical protein